MAMRPRGGRGRPNREPQLIVGRVYEPFKPMSEWRQGDDYDTVLVYLPGFQQEYLKVTTEDLNIVRVRGERLVAENKWSRFQEDFRVPRNCEMSGVRASFNGGILNITMPRKIITAPPPPPPTTTTRVPHKSKEPPFRREKQEETLVQKPKEDSKERATSSNAALQKPLDEGSTSTLPPQPQPTPTKQEPAKTAGPEADGESTFGSKNDGTVEKGKTKEAVVGSQGGKVEETAVVKGGDGWRGSNEEDRKMVVNMGVGVLVIVALGIHVSYTIGLIGKGK
ncbi:protein RESTRICTED TEV MOVEMENT 2-like [Cynara cardunculus var. scolymus]|uniref:Alpha crystallin/Hsp20 domain-containing protein n=1 Tax=Cynara cardunculus var. scolymus TaxID=59895 RepID=A0A103YEW4_CYNCS|nr:protein RESTRICTED TEV MOVEMENT 2-like [Cynara cardunculus var. scolymus]KVI07810.1 Alpha crystallin/Hsp20 domain-containing protein [Cynara cardunculus var. scolymus]